MNIKPCPFCGLHPTITEWRGYARSYHIDRDGNEVQDQYSEYEIKCCGVTATDPEKWNTRHIPLGYVLVPIDDVKDIICFKEGTVFYDDAKSNLSAIIQAVQESE